MIQIIPANKLILSVLGKQIYTRDDAYRLSSFCLYETVSEGTLIYNNLTKELVLVESTLSALSSEDYDFLVENWFYVDESANELQTSDCLTDILRYSLQKTEKKSFTILPTSGCNARCFYCFEKGIKPEIMSFETAQQTAAFIVSNCTATKSASIRWFGGEPLLNTSAIDTICSLLKKNEINIASSIVTNGYLFDEKLINHAILDWNLKSIQITLDGTETVYNKAKAFVYPNCNAYRTVLNNLITISKFDVQLNIRLNIDEYNLSDMNALIEELSILLVTKKHISINAVPLFENAGATKIPRSDEQRDYLLKKIHQINQYAYSLGFNQGMRLNTAVSIHFCGADSKNSVVIMPNGNLVRCEHFVEHSVHGNVHNTSVMSNGMWTQYSLPLDICQDCPLYPTCHRVVGCSELENCSPAIKKWRIIDLKDQMLAEYNRYSKKKE